MIQKADYSLMRYDANQDYPAAADLSKLGDSLLRMGDAEGAKNVPDFQSDSVLWKVQKNDETIGYMWITLQESGDMQAPSLHFVVKGSEDLAYSLAKEAIRYAYCNLPYTTLYSRHLMSNESSSAFDKKIGFEKDGDTYDDERGQKWQNVSLVL